MWIPLSACLPTVYTHPVSTMPVKHCWHTFIPVMPECYECKHIPMSFQADKFVSSKMWDLRLSQQCWWRYKSSGRWWCIRRVVPHVLMVIQSFKTSGTMRPISKHRTPQNLFLPIPQISSSEIWDSMVQLQISTICWDVKLSSLVETYKILWTNLLHPSSRYGK